MKKQFPRIYKSIRGFFKDMSYRNAPVYASSAAFFFFMSLFPALMFLFSLTKYLPFDAQDIFMIFDSVVPEALAVPLDHFIYQIYNTSTSLIPVTAIVTLWAANMGMMGLVRGLNGIYGIEDKRNYFALRGMATVYTVLMLSGIVASLILIAFGRGIVSTIALTYPRLGTMLHKILYLRSIFIFLILSLLFALIYAYLPAANQSFMHSIPGAVAASAGWIIVTFALSFYIKYFNGFSLYGNLTTIMVFLVWLYMCFTILIAGAFFNEYYNNFIASKYSDFQNKKNNKKALRQERKVKK